MSLHWLMWQYIKGLIKNEERRKINNQLSVATALWFRLKVFHLISANKLSQFVPVTDSSRFRVWLPLKKAFIDRSTTQQTQTFSCSHLVTCIHCCITHAPTHMRTARILHLITPAVGVFLKLVWGMWVWEWVCQRHQIFIIAYHFHLIN